MGTCESCGASEADLFLVRRTYPGAEGGGRTLDEIESWCFSCCTSYPHEPVESEPGAS